MTSVVTDDVVAASGMEPENAPAWEQPSGDELVRVVAALANAHRLRMLAVLSKERIHVSQLAREVRLSRPLVHMHLRKLEDAGLVVGNLELSKKGKAMKFYEVTPFVLRLTPEVVAKAARTLSEPVASSGKAESR